MGSEARKADLVQELHKYILKMILTLLREGNGYSVLGLIFFSFFCKRIQQLHLYSQLRALV